jgi:menaquinone-specific isochorismate synthase
VATIPALSVATTEVADPGPLVPLLDRQSPLLWSRRGFGLAGFGEALRLEFSGANRFTDAAAAWRAVAAAATITDPLDRTGTGLLAFGSFAFADRSARTSVLIVPSLIVGRDHDRSWITTVGDVKPTLSPPILPPSTPYGDPFSVVLDQGSLDREAYVAAVATAVSRIHQRELSKVVIARDATARLPRGADIRRLIDSLAARYPDCWTFCIDGFLGASPETLVSVDSGTVSARVLAGSAARGTDAASDQAAATALATSAKDQDEHQFAVQNVLASLRSHSPTVTASEQPFTLKLPNLWHLASDIDGELSDGSTSLDLVRALHPTAAVAGTPTENALELISELEPFDRGRYAGPVGWVSADGDGEWAVALRSAQVSGDLITAYAGAGIVAESVPERELLETRMKFRPIVEALAGG